MYLNMTFTNKKILIFGGTGSLGYEITKRYINTNNIYFNISFPYIY